MIAIFSMFALIYLIYWNYIDLEHEREQKMLRWQLYKSDRYIVTGNLAFRICITDTFKDKSYEIMHSNLVKFRGHWTTLSDKNKDTFLRIVTFKEQGKAVNKRVA